MIIFEDIVPKPFQNDIEHHFLSGNFPWYLTKETVGNDPRSSFYDDKSLDCQQFVHLFFGTPDGIVSNNYFQATPFIVMLEDKTGRSFSDRLLRVKANLIPQSNFPKGFYNPPHSDWGGENPDMETETLLYYVNDSDGDTLLFNEKPPTESISLMGKVEPKKGRAVLFDSNLLHCGTPPIVSQNRCVINFVFRK
jgi:hypothetical protein